MSTRVQSLTDDVTQCGVYFTVIEQFLTAYPIPRTQISRNWQTVSELSMRGQPEQTSGGSSLINEVKVADSLPCRGSSAAVAAIRQATAAQGASAFLLLDTRTEQLAQRGQALQLPPPGPSAYRHLHQPDGQRQAQSPLQQRRRGSGW